MPSEPNPMENLHDILMCPPHQRVDVTALVDDVSSIREATTAQGQRYIADIKIRDESGPENRCECNFTVFLPKTPSSRSALEALADLARRREPVTFFALQCDIKDTNSSVRPDWDRFRWAHCSSGARAEALKTNAENVLEPSAAVTVISRIAEYEPKEPTD